MCTHPDCKLNSWDLHHNDTLMWSDKITLYFDLRGKQVSKKDFDRGVAHATAFEEARRGVVS